MALQKKIYCIYQLNQYEISWDKYCQLYPSWDEACYLDSGSRKRQGRFCLSHRNRKQEACHKRTAPTLSCSLSQFICWLKTCREEKKGRVSEGSTETAASEQRVGERLNTIPATHTNAGCVRWGEMAQWVKSLVFKPLDLNSIPTWWEHKSNFDTLSTGVSQYTNIYIGVRQHTINYTL